MYEAIDLSKDFRWIYNYIPEADKKFMEAKGLSDKLIKVDLKDNPDSLSKLLV